MKRKLYFSFSILLVHNTLPTLSVSVIKASLSIRILWEVVVFPLHVSSQRTNGPWSPRSEKERKRHAATETCGAWDHVSFFLLHWILLCCCSLLTHSLALTRLSPILPLRTPTPLSGPYAPYPSLSYALLLLRGPLAQPRVSYPPYHIVSGYSKL